MGSENLRLSTWLRAVAAWLTITVPLLGAMAWMLSQHSHPHETEALRREIQQLRLEVRDELRAIRRELPR